MNVKKRKKSYLALMQSIRIMLGSSAAICIAMHMNLESATSAGIITLLTLLTTKIETVRLSFYRIISFVFTVGVSYVIFQYINILWLSYGVFIFLVVFFTEMIGWRATLSVNAVIGTHYLSTIDYGMSFVFNEFMLVIIGISIAIVINLFNGNNNIEKYLIHNMQYTESCLQQSLGELGKYLNCEEMDVDIWKKLRDLESELEEFISQACNYDDNTFKKNGDYYKLYFEMRLMQLGVLHNLHYKIKSIRNIPSEAKIISDYIGELKEYVIELNDPTPQIQKLKNTISEILIKDLPQNSEELEVRARLYHILTDIEEFLMFKMRFVDKVLHTEKYKKDYHNNKYI